MFAMTSEEVANYHQDGVIIPAASLAKETVKEMRVNLDRFLSEYEGDADFVSAWIALDDVDTDNGCLRVIPGSHKQRKLLPHQLDNGGEGVLSLKLSEADWQTAEHRDLILKAGQFSFHDVFITRNRPK